LHPTATFQARPHWHHHQLLLSVFRPPL